MKYFTSCWLFVFLLISFISCKYYEPDPPTYGIQVKVEGNQLNQIYFRSTQQNFDVTNVPTKHWLVDMSNRMKGNDTILLYGRQTTDTITPIIVSIRVNYNDGPTLTYSDTGATEAQVKVYLPK